MAQLGYQPGTTPLRGHGVHWLNEGGVLATQGYKPADRNDAEGLNVPADASSVKALFWGDPATPLFEDATASGGLSTLDYPTPGGVWTSKPVQAFVEGPPAFFTSEHEFWHAHGGLCATVQDLGSGPETVLEQFSPTRSASRDQRSIRWVLTAAIPG